MIRLLHLADLHLDAPLGGFGAEAERRSAEVLDAFRRLPDAVAERAFDAVLLCGDLFDRPRPSDATIAVVRETIRRIQQTGAAVFAVHGNHDAARTSAAAYERALPDVHIFGAPRFEEPVELELDGATVRFHGLSYDPAVESDPLSTFEPSAEIGLDVVLLHGAVPGAPQWEAGSALQLSLDALRGFGADYLALGDLHRFRDVSEFGPGLPACYPGSFAAVDTSETGVHGWVDVTIDDEESGSVSTSLVSAGVREVVAPDPVDVSDLASDEEVADAIAAGLPAEALPVVGLIGEPEFPLDPETVLAHLTERFGFALVRDDTRFFAAARLAELMDENTVVGHVARLGLEDIDRAGCEADRRAAADGLRLALRVLGVR